MNSNPQSTHNKKLELHKLWWRHPHGLAGLVFVTVSLVEVFLFLIQKQPTLILTAILVLSALPFAGGIFTYTFRRRLKRLGTKKFVFLRTTAWLFAFLGLALSIYAQPDFKIVDTTFLRWIFTAIYATGTALAIFSAFHEVRHMTIFADGFVIANVTSNALLLAMPLLHLFIGTTRLASLYTQYPIGNTVYILMIYTCFIVAIDTFMLGLVTNLKLRYSRYRSLSAITWAVFFLSGSALLLWYQLSWQVALIYYLSLTVLFLISRRIKFPIVENQVGLLDQIEADKATRIT